MKIKKVSFSEDILTWENDITTAEWMEILLDTSMVKDDLKDILYKFYKAPNHSATCRALGEKYNQSAPEINAILSHFGKAVQKKLDRFQVIGTDNEVCYWIIPMFGKLDRHALSWEIRPELVEAMENVFIDGNPFNRKPLAKIPKAKKAKKIYGTTIKQYVDLLSLSKNLVFTGVIGTGKTFLARSIADALHAEVETIQFHPGYRYADLIEGKETSPFNQTNPEGETIKDGIFKTFCKKAWTNLRDSKKTKEALKEDKMLEEGMKAFVEQINDEIFEVGEFVIFDEDKERYATITDIDNHNFTAISGRGKTLVSPWENMVSKYKRYIQHEGEDWTLMQVEKELSITRNHRLYLLLLSAFDAFYKENKVDVEVEKVERKDFVFIIDEIAKANLSDVFGEVLYAMNPENRGEKGKVQTQYNKMLPSSDIFYEGFFVPENVYIIGTMNDLAIEDKPMDMSIIRKFTWKRIDAMDRINMWDEEIKEYKEEALQRMTAINKEIDDIEGLNELYHIGPAYFLKLKEFNGDFDALWDNYLEGLLMRYFIRRPNMMEIIKQLKSAYSLEKASLYAPY